jgi:hypothetical protein
MYHISRYANKILCVVCYLKLRDKHRLWVFESRMLGEGGCGVNRKQYQEDGKIS